MISTLSTLTLIAPLSFGGTVLGDSNAEGASAWAPLGSSTPSSAASALFQDDPDEPEDKRAEVKELIDKLKDHTKRRGDEDEEAVAVIDQLYSEFSESGPRDRASIVKALERAFKEKRRDLEDDVPDRRLKMAVAVAFKDMAPESVKPLIAWVEDVEDDLVLRRQLILSLGNTKDVDAVDPLVDLLNEAHPGVQAAASEALGEFEGADLEVRKEAFKKLLDLIMRVRGIIDQDPNDIIERDRYDTIAGPIVTSLQRLSGHDERDPHEWQRWWNKNKRDDWDEG